MECYKRLFEAGAWFRCVFKMKLLIHVTVKLMVPQYFILNDIFAVISAIKCSNLSEYRNF